MHAAENMPEFDPGSSRGRSKSAKAFLTRLRALQRHYGWSDFLLLEAAQQKLRGQAQVWNDESPEIYTTFAAFEADLSAAYPAYSSSADALEDIFAQQRGQNERLEDFCRRMSVLGRRAQIPDADMAQYIVKRIDHTQFVTSIGCVRITSVAALLEAIVVFEQKWPQTTGVRITLHTTTRKEPQQFAAGSQMKPSTHQHTAGANMAAPNRPAAITSHANQPTTTAAAGAHKCWNCRVAGHAVRDCPSPLIKCTNCRRYGHLAKDCRSNPRAERVYRIDGDDDDTGAWTTTT